MPVENKKQLLIIIGAVIAGIVAVVLASHYIQSSIENQTAVLSEKWESSQKEMAAQLQEKSDQQAAALEQRIEQVKAQEDQAMQKQTIALQQAMQQEARTAPQGSPARLKVRHPSLALKTPAGKRAVTILIDSLAAVGGLLNAGDFVDVIAQLNAPSQDPDNKTVTAMIFQGLQILAVNTTEDEQGAYDEQQAAATLKITVAVDPQEAGLLSFADKNGKLQLALRSPDDTDHQTVKADTWKTLADYVLKNQGLDIQDPDGENQKNNKPVDNSPIIQIFRGGKEL